VTGLAVLAAVVLAYALVSRRLERSVVSAPMVFVAAGILAGPDALDLVNLDATHGTAFHVAELALAILLFSDAARIDVHSLRGNASLPGRLLGIGMPATIALGMAAGAVLLTELEFWEAAIVAAVLAPTDAALGQAVQSNPLVPQRIRQALNLEGGLNDGLSVPFLALFLAIAANETVPQARDWLGFAAEQIGLGTIIGVATGGIGAWLVERASGRDMMTDALEQLAVLALAVLAFVLADEAGGNGFIAAFVGGLAAGGMGKVCGKRILAFTEEQGQLLSLSVFFIFGVAAVGFLDDVDWRVAIYAALSLTLVRMLPVALAVAGMGFRASSIAFMGWFGPRGLASIILALVVAEEEPELPALGTIMATMTVVVLASVVLHGLSARPLVALYARKLEDLPGDAPELSAHRSRDERASPHTGDDASPLTRGG
jgi:NhaP-type Na+/H+ or K+/H+ antiporter